MHLYFSLRNLAIIFLCCAPSASSQHNERLPESDVALALGGGGFLSITDMAGLTAGLLSVLMQEDNKLQQSDNALSQSGLFDRVGSISSISGGSWFATKLAYSQDFREMIESVANQTRISVDSGGGDIDETLKAVSKAYNALYTKELLDISVRGEDTWFYNLASSILAPLKIFGIGSISESMKQSLGFLALLKQDEPGHFSWSHVIDYVLSDIPKTTLIGDPVQKWAENKTWRIIVSSVTPNSRFSLGENPFSLLTADVLYDVAGFGLARGPFIEYTVVPKPDAMLLPASFSSVLGCKECAAPYPYDSSGLLATYSTDYEGRHSFRTWWNRTEGPVMGAKMSEKDNFFDTPVHGPVGASSAFVGALTVSKDVARAFKLLDVDPSVYFASQLSGKDAFEAPAKIMNDIWRTNDPTKAKGMELKEMGAHEITDGGGTDPHGIATAVATGANDVFVVDVVENIMSWKCHFAGFKLPDVAEGLGLTDVWQLFAGDQKEAERQEKSNIRAMKSLPKRNKKWAENIYYGTIQGTTIDNKYYNIEAGRVVNVHVFYVEVGEGMSIGLGQNFNDYGELVSEITATFNLAKNAPVVQSMIQMLKGPSGAEKKEEL